MVNGREETAIEGNERRLRIIRSRRKTAAIQIGGPDLVIIRAPLRMPEREILRLAEEKRDWIEKHLALAAAREQLPRLTEAELQELARQAREKIPPRVQAWAGRVGVSYGRITIRTQRTRWGSCSSRGILNFNCLLAGCPEAVMDYVIVHELCHRKELNHSPRFWAEVERVLPEYRTALRWLKTEGQELISRLD